MNGTGSEYSLDPILLMALTLMLALSPVGSISDIISYVTISVRLVTDKLVTLTTPLSLNGQHHYHDNKTGTHLMILIT